MCFLMLRKIVFSYTGTDFSERIAGNSMASMLSVRIVCTLKSNHILPPSAPILPFFVSLFLFSLCALLANVFEIQIYHTEEQNRFAKDDEQIFSVKIYLFSPFVYSRAMGNPRCNLFAVRKWPQVKN